MSRMSRRFHAAHRLLAMLLCVAPLAGCLNTPKPKPPPEFKTAPKPEPTVAATTAALMGRWILSPGDCVMSESAEKTERDAKEPFVSPAGAVLVLANGGMMLAHEGDFIRKGSWRFEGASLRIVVEPPPRRIEMGFVPTIEGDQLTLTGADKMVLVYHRDPFIAVKAEPAPVDKP
jgi:hypothetical protein